MKLPAYLKLYLRVFRREYCVDIFKRDTRNRSEPQDSGKRRKSRPTTQYAYCIITKWGLPKGKRLVPTKLAMAIEAMRNAFLNIPQGNRAAVVVREP